MNDVDDGGLPSLADLERGLKEALGSGPHSVGIEVLTRVSFLGSSTYPSEVVSVRLPDGARRRVFCKYGRDGQSDSHGHRGGVRREAVVYRDVLSNSSLSAPQLLGSYRDSDSLQTWLFLEYLDGSSVVRSRPGLLPAAAAWIGRFHRESLDRLTEPWVSHVGVYDLGYFTGWAERARNFAAEVGVGQPLVAEICDRFEEVARELVDTPLCLIHGEFYPNNILARGGVLYPVDWESAAIGVGEVDIAMLTERWPARATHDCIAAYSAARWPGGAPSNFERRLAISRVYVHLRWLGEREDWYHGCFTRSEDRLRADASVAGLIQGPVS